MANVSVAMAAYNGEKFIRAQIDSVLDQLAKNDELIISCNPSSDNTEEIIKEYVAKDDRVKLFMCDKKGVLNNFENAIRKCSNEIIFLCDQDDVWFDDKISVVKKYFIKSEVGAVVHGCILTDMELNRFMTHSDETRKKAVITISPLSIVIKNRVQGSCMAFRRRYLKYILPFPKAIPMHDSWIGIIISTLDNVIMINKPLMYYRQHDNNVTSRHHKRLGAMLKDRIYLVICYIRRIVEIKLRLQK